MKFRKVIVVGLDGLEPKLVDALMARKELPNLAKLRDAGGYSRVATTYPAQTPVAWSTFATGLNPGGHGIFDFLTRDPATYLPTLALNRFEQKNAFVPPKPVNLRRGTPVWDVLKSAGIGSTIVRCPCSFPPDSMHGRMLCGMGVPDLRGGLGTSTFFTTHQELEAEESEKVVTVRVDGGVARTQLVGPRNPKGGDFTLDITLKIDTAARSLTVISDGQPGALPVGEGKWSDWLKVKFKLGMLQSARGMVRFFLTRLSPMELYCSPVNYDPSAPLFPISAPPEYAAELEKHLGTYYTTGMVEDHGGLNNGRFDEYAYLDQCRTVLRERERMMVAELGRKEDGLFFCLFDTPDRLGHMMWRFREPDHPANAGRPVPDDLRIAMDTHYRACDEIVGKALQFADDRTLLIVLSDHGMTSFRRGVNLNTWLQANGFLALKVGVKRGHEASDFFKNVDWSRTKAYALGLGGAYLNLSGREAHGSLSPADAEQTKAAIANGLTGLRDDQRGGAVAINSVVTREEVYRGPCVGDAPDLLVNFNAGYRVSWSTALGGVPDCLIEDNTRKWGGDHIIDPALVPGVLFMNHAFRGNGARLLDLAPTICAALGAPPGAAMEGVGLL
ncbi:MAG: alkaline phosphatase family protein [Phycisphaerae bacterium]